MILNDTVTLIGIKQDMYFNGKFNASTFAQNDLNRIINKYYKIVQADIRGVNEDFFMVSATTDLPLYSINNGVYGFPTDYEKVKKILVATAPASSATPLESEYIPVVIADANQITDPSYAFTNPTAVIFGTYFVLYPQFINVAIYPVTKGVKMYYIQQQVDLANDADTPNIFSDYHDLITWGSLIDTSIRLGNEKLQAKAEKMFDKRRKEMKESASQRILFSAAEYVEGQGNDGGWAFPYGKTGI